MLGLTRSVKRCTFEEIKVGFNKYERWYCNEKEGSEEAVSGYGKSIFVAKSLKYLVMKKNACAFGLISALVLLISLLSHNYAYSRWVNRQVPFGLMPGVRAYELKEEGRIATESFLPFLQSDTSFFLFDDSEEGRFALSDPSMFLYSLMLERPGHYRYFSDQDRVDRTKVVISFVSPLDENRLPEAYTGIAYTQRGSHPLALPGYDGVVNASGTDTLGGRLYFYDPIPEAMKNTEDQLSDLGFHRVRWEPPFIPTVVRSVLANSRQGALFVLPLLLYALFFAALYYHYYLMRPVLASHVRLGATRRQLFARSGGQWFLWSLLWGIPVVFLFSWIRVSGNVRDAIGFSEIVWVAVIHYGLLFILGTIAFLQQMKDLPKELA